MKLLFFISGLILGGMSSFYAGAQSTLSTPSTPSTPSTLTGAWEGKLNAGSASLRLVLHLSPATGDSLYASMDSPDQGAMGIAADKAYQQHDSVFVYWPSMMAAFKGKIQDSLLTGVWQQRGASLPLQWRKTQQPTVLHRPQTPQPPFPYQSTDLIFQNKNKGITYGATLTVPKGKGPFPALLLLTGSGPQNRDEELLGHKPFAVLADFLTRRGYAVLRVDDRGVGQTTGNPEDASQKDLLDDATAAFEFLKSRPEVNKKKLGVLGHSQGGMTAQIMGAQRNDIDFVILMAAPGVSGVEMMTAQNELVLRSMGRKKEDAALYGKLYRAVANALLQSRDSADASRRLQPIVTDWRRQTDKKTALATTGIDDSVSQTAYIAAFSAIANDPGMLDIYRYNPAPYLKKIKAKVLALNGSEDIQVASELNLGAIKAALANGIAKSYEVKELPGINHLFQKCSKCTVPEYGQLEETLNPALLEVIGNWLATEVK